MNRYHFQFNPTVLPYLAQGGGGVATTLKLIAGRVQAQAKADAPVGKTGHLRDSIRTTQGSEEGRIAFFVGTDVPYARFQEYGTDEGVEPTHFLSEALPNA